MLHTLDALFVVAEVSIQAVRPGTRVGYAALLVGGSLYSQGMREQAAF